MNIRRNFDAFLIVDCRIDKHTHFVNIVFRFREFRRRFAMWKNYFVSMTNVFDSRKATCLKLFNLWTKKNQRFFSNSNMFFRNCYASSVTDLLNELVHLFFFVWRKKWKRLLFLKVYDDWWGFDFLTNFFLFVFVIFWFFIFFLIFESFVFLKISFFFVSLFFQMIVKFS